MRDLSTEIAQALSDDIEIKRYCDKRIKLYEFPETGDDKKTFIVISPSPSTPVGYASNRSLQERYDYRINIESHSRIERDLVSHAVRKVMTGLGFGQSRGGLDTYFNDTKRYVISNSYTATLIND